MVILAPVLQAAISTSRLLARRFCTRKLEPNAYISKTGDVDEDQVALYAAALAELIKATTTSMPTRFIPTQLIGTAPANHLRAIALLRQLLGTKPVR